jgi:PadR family transcriptional regulator, regulatory protein AphA
MSLNHAILGILSRRPLTGYDLKKIMQDSAYMPWSGNNNQIYKALVELLERGYLTNEIQHQDGAPSKKSYTITEQGLAELKRWTLTEPEPPEFRKVFLIRLASSGQLSDEELGGLLSRYEVELRSMLLYQEEKHQRETAGTQEDGARHTLIHHMIHANVMDFYRQELSWMQEMRDKLFELQRKLNEGEEKGR